MHVHHAVKFIPQGGGKAAPFLNRKHENLFKTSGRGPNLKPYTRGSSWAVTCASHRVKFTTGGGKLVALHKSEEGARVWYGFKAVKARPRAKREKEKTL